MKANKEDTEDCCYAIVATDESYIHLNHQICFVHETGRDTNFKKQQPAAGRKNKSTNLSFSNL